jgi:hypothetical protein
MAVTYWQNCFPPRNTSETENIWQAPFRIPLDAVLKRFLWKGKKRKFVLVLKKLSTPLYEIVWGRR